MDRARAWARARARRMAATAATAATVSIALGLTACGGARTGIPGQSRTAVETGSLLATPSAASPTLERFSAPGMGIHFLYPAAFKPLAPGAPSQPTGSAVSTEASYAEVGLSQQDVLFVVDEHRAPQRVTLSDAKTVEAGFDREIDRLTLSSVTATIDPIPGTGAGKPAVAFEWPAVEDPQLTHGGDDQYSEIFIGDSEYELECISTPQDHTRVGIACSDALASLTFTDN